MANTLKLGAGKWATGTDTVLAFNDENNNFKPLPFDFSRASSATVVNQSGLIETVGSGTPRIDFKDDTKGALLLEPLRTNLVTYSEEFDNAYWSKSNVNISKHLSIKAPDGSYNANHIVDLGGGSIVKNPIASITDTKSIYVRTVSGVGKLHMLNFSNESDSLIDVDENWQRIEIPYNGQSFWERFYLCDFRALSTVSEILIWGAQLEQGSYATSYIPTSGSAVTRVAETCSQTPPSGVIGQTEGTVFFDVNISHVVGNEAIGTINSGGYANHATIQRIGNTIQFVRNSATQSGATIVTSSAITVGRYRLALAYKSGDTACFLNGTQVSTTQTQTFTNGTLNLVKISGDAIGALPFADTYNQSQLYNTRLSNAELASLTTI